MKDSIVEKEFRIHHEVLFLEKNINNVTNNKYLISLGRDKKALRLKIWDFKSLMEDEYTKDAFVTDEENPFDNNDQESRLRSGTIGLGSQQTLNPYLTEVDANDQKRLRTGTIAQRRPEVTATATPTPAAP